MDNLLWDQAQQAISAGNTREAHVHLAKLLKQEPKNVDAWYLLSAISVSEKKEIFLKKILKLDPDHAQAATDLEALRQPAEMATEISMPADAVSTDEGDFELQSSGGTIPDWMSDAPPPIEMPDMEVDAAKVEDPLDDPVIPDWLRDEPSQIEPIPTKPDPISVAEPAPIPPNLDAVSPPAPAKPRAKRKQSQPVFSPLLIGLIITALFVTFVLVYLLVSYFLI